MSAPPPNAARLGARPESTQSAASPVFILCDGIVCDGYIYKYLWDDLALYGGVAHWNYRGHGRSALPVDVSRIGVVDHARDLDAVRWHLGDPEVVLVGHSFGTQVALEAYRLRPERVRALILISGSFGRVTYTFKNSDVLAAVLPNLIQFAERHPRLARALWSRMPVNFGIAVARMTGDIDLRSIRPEEMRPYFEHAAHVDFEMFLRMLREAGEHSAEDLLPQIGVPTLVLTGDRDSFTPASVSEGMARAIPNAEFHVVPSGTHILPLEHRAEVASQIATFLARCAVG